jgi:hypothetical protein
VLRSPLARRAAASNGTFAKIPLPILPLLRLNFSRTVYGLRKKAMPSRMLCNAQW